ncbi:ATP-binding protein, partial [Kitasatospora sp. NPDC001574]
MNDLGNGKTFSGARRCAFAGRESELQLLLGVVSGARPAVILVEGEAGIGKSRLVEEASAALRAQGLRVLLGGCHPLREPLAYGPVIDALRPIGPWLPPVERLAASAGALAPFLPDLAAALPEPPPEPPPELSVLGAGRFRVVSGVRTLLEAVAPAALVVEDVHWADEATRELLLLLATDMPRDVALVLTYRAEDLPGGRPVLGVPFRRPAATGGAEIVLGPLGEAELRAMARDALGGEPATALVRALLERSGGLPLVIEEDLITLARSPGAADTAALRVPRSLGEVLAERRARLGPDAAALVNAAAVLAVPSAQTLLAETAGLDGTCGDDALMEALGAAVLRQLGPDTYGFGHVLAQEAAYDDIPGPVRNRTHQRVLEVLLAQDPPPLVQIAHHSRAMGDLTAWLLRAQAAADQATAVGDHGTAAALLGEIIDHPGLTPEQLTQAAWALSYTASAGTEVATTVQSLRRILRLAALPDAVRGGIRISLGALLIYDVGDLSGEEELVTALPEVEGGDPAAAARLLALLALSTTDRFSLAEQRDMVERGSVLLAGNEDVHARALLDLARFLLRCVVADPAVPELLAALPREGDDLQTLRGTAILVTGSIGRSLGIGHDERVAAGIAEARAVASRARMPVLGIHLDAFQVASDWHAGRWDEAERGLAAFRERYPDSPFGLAALLATMRGLTAAARGLNARAAAEFGQV